MAQKTTNRGGGSPAASASTFQLSLKKVLASIKQRPNMWMIIGGCILLFLILVFLILGGSSSSSKFGMIPPMVDWLLT